MSRYSDQIRDEYGRTVPKVAIYVYKWDAYAQVAGDLETLTDDLAAPLTNPLTSDPDGIYYFNSPDGQKLLEYHYGGKVQERSLILVGALPVPQAAFGGLFVNAAALTIPVGMDLICTTGFSVLDVGAAIYTYDAAVNAAYVIAHPLSSFVTVNNRGFRLSLEQDLTPEMLGATGLGVADDYPAFVATTNLIPSSGGAIHVLGGTYNLSTEPTWGTKVITWDISPAASFTGAGTGTGKFPSTVARFTQGRLVPIAASKAGIEKVMDDPSSPLENEGSIWTGAVPIRLGINKRRTSADGAAGSPSITLMVRAENDGCLADVCAGVFTAVATQSTGSVFGINVIARNSASDGGASKMVCAEFDWEDADASAEAGTSGAVFVNAFNSLCPVGLQFGAVGAGGGFTNGIGFLCNVTGAALYANTGTLGALTNSGSATYSTAAHILSNTHRIRFSGTASAHGYIYADASNNLRVVGCSVGTSFRNNADTVTLVTIIDDPAAGLVDLTSSGGQYRVNGTKVVGARDTGWAADTGTAKKTANATYAAGTTLTYSAAYVQSEQTAMATRVAALELIIQANSQTIKALKDAWLAHGGIGT